MIKELTKLANHLDAKGHRREADYLDAIIKNAQVPLPNPTQVMPDATYIRSKVYSVEVNGNIYRWNGTKWEFICTSSDWRTDGTWKACQGQDSSIVAPEAIDISDLQSDKIPPFKEQA